MFVSFSFSDFWDQREREEGDALAASVLSVNQLVLQELVTVQISMAVYATAVNQLFKSGHILSLTLSHRIIGRLPAINTD